MSEIIKNECLDQSMYEEVFSNYINLMNYYRSCIKLLPKLSQKKHSDRYSRLTKVISKAVIKTHNDHSDEIELSMITPYTTNQIVYFKERFGLRYIELKRALFMGMHYNASMDDLHKIMNNVNKF